jgi:putative tricarboxylic transport membrane protein
MGSWQSPAPGLFPLLVSLVLAGLALTLLLVTLGTHAPAPPGESPAARPTKVWWTLVSLLAFYALLEWLGFLLASFLLLFFLLRAIAGQRWRVTLAISVGASLSSYLVFDRLLKLPLPRGPIGF